MKSSIQLLPIDFSRPWWHVITIQPWLAAGVAICVIFRDLFWVLLPFMITMLLEHKSWYLFAVFCLLWAIVFLNQTIFTHINTRFQLQVIHSIFDSAYRYLLTIDPYYHTKRSSGTMLAKIERAARGYEDVFDQLTYSFIPLTISISTMLTILGSYSLFLMLAVCVCLSSMIGYAYYFTKYSCQIFEQDFIESDDAFKSIAFENMAQVQLVRSAFAADYAQKKLEQKIDTNSVTEKRLWLSYAYVSTVVNIQYGLSIILLVGFFIYALQHQLISLPYAISIILAYIQSTFQLIRLLHPLRRYIRGVTAINDLFRFMLQFGKQTMPVMEKDTSTNYPADGELSIVASSISFSYDNNAPIFENITLDLRCQPTQKNKLYGIIGPSGTGKTTLLAILGGQLKPTVGTVYINSIDIYAVGDATRRKLIALQGQMATSMKGTVRYSLLFGLPESHGYTDAYLEQVLDKVGLKSIFDELDGLDTILGEGAINISGGQRQRLNFASLYLRARFYKPVVVLIDEPTSSLDEISEIAVTKMILELAVESITLVIAHRLKTVEESAGFIDVSLTTPNTTLKAHNAKDLQLHSAYYRQLIENPEKLQSD